MWPNNSFKPTQLRGGNVLRLGRSYFAAAKPVGLTQALGAMKITVALLMAIALTGCGASRAEKQQQDFFEVQAYSYLKRDMKEQEILSWAEQHKLSRVSDGSKDIILFAPGITTRLPHFPCAKTFTQIRIKLTDSNGLASYQLGRGGICL